MMIAVISELEFGAGNQVSQGTRDPHRPGLRPLGDARSDMNGDPFCGVTALAPARLSSIIQPIMSVSNVPGAMALTRTPREAHSSEDGERHNPSWLTASSW
jgi:hypothetical protein